MAHQKDLSIAPTYIPIYLLTEKPKVQPRSKLTECPEQQEQQFK